jgi:hypothetical protein
VFDLFHGFDYAFAPVSFIPLRRLTRSDLFWVKVLKCLREFVLWQAKKRGSRGVDVCSV